MKNSIAILLVLICLVAYSQEEVKKNQSFLTRNQPIELFAEVQLVELSNAFKLKLPPDVNSGQMFQSDFLGVMPTNTRLMNYPARDLGDHNNVTFGTFHINSVNLGKTKMQTFYLFDHTGRLVDSTTSFSFGN